MQKNLNGVRGLMHAILSLQEDKGAVSRFSELILPTRESKWCNVSREQDTTVRAHYSSGMSAVKT